MNKLKNKNRQAHKRGSRNSPSSGHVPPFIPTLKLSHKFRFLNGTNSGTFTITRARLLNLYLVATSTTTTARLMEAVRLRRVEVWTNPTALGAAPASCSLEWLGVQGSSTVTSDTTMGVTPAHIVCLPPRDSSDVWWSISNTNETDPLFTLILAANSVVDVTLDLRMVEQEAPFAGDIPTGAVLGTVYGDYLDGIGSAMLAPVGLTPLP
jgi:hypothetical protein